MQTSKPQTGSLRIEAAGYTKYYEHDGMLRAYANRTMVLATIFGVIALCSLGFAIYVRLEPPTVIRVDKDGNASIVGASRFGPSRVFSLASEAATAPVGGGDTVTALVDNWLVQPASV